MQIEIKTESKMTAEGPRQTWWVNIGGCYVPGTLSTTLSEAERYYDTLKESGVKATFQETIKQEEI